MSGGAGLNESERRYKMNKKTLTETQSRLFDRMLLRHGMGIPQASMIKGKRG